MCQLTQILPGPPRAIFYFRPLETIVCGGQVLLSSQEPCHHHRRRRRRHCHLFMFNARGPRERSPVRVGTHVLRLNFKTSCVAI